MCMCPTNRTNGTGTCTRMDKNRLAMKFACRIYGFWSGAEISCKRLSLVQLVYKTMNTRVQPTCIHVYHRLDWGTIMRGEKIMHTLTFINGKLRISIINSLNAVFHVPPISNTPPHSTWSDWNSNIHSSLVHLLPELILIVVVMGDRVDIITFTNSHTVANCFYRHTSI